MTASKPLAHTTTDQETLLDSLLDETFADHHHGLPRHLWEQALLGPVREFLRRPGKLFRARLVETCWILAGGPPDRVPAELPLLVELLHAGSLIVDDIEDDSCTRRGAPALHKIYGTSIALNTGNWMYFWPFVLLERMDLPREIRDDIHRRASRTLMHCHQGQALDLALNITTIEQRDVAAVVRSATELKTAALMEFAAVLGAIAVGAETTVVHAIATFGRELGIGLQMLDDLGGLTCAARQHKGAEDLRLGRPTWPWAWAASATSAQRFRDLQALGQAVSQGADHRPLATALATISADTGRARVQSRLSLALAVLRDSVPQSPALIDLAQEIQLLEQSYG